MLHYCVPQKFEGRYNYIKAAGCTRPALKMPPDIRTWRCMWKKYNPNPAGKNVGDCTIRALSKGLNQDWAQTYAALILQGYMMSDMPSANSVWGAYLRHRGFTRHIIPEDCPDCYTVTEFACDHPRGTYILALSGHVVCLVDGDWYDTWDSGQEVPLYYWMRG